MPQDYDDDTEDDVKSESSDHDSGEETEEEKYESSDHDNGEDTEEKEEETSLEDLKKMEDANKFKPKDLKKASDFIRSQSPKKIFGIYFDFWSASIPQLQSLRKVLAELKTKTPAFVRLDFYTNEKLTDDLMLQYLDELKKLTSL